MRDAFADNELEEQSTSKLSVQALEFFLHSLLALASWIGLMLLGYAIHPAGVPQLMILLLSSAVPFVVGFLVARIHSSEMASVIWLLGLTWFLILCLWVLDMPTGPNQCLQCGASEKLTRTFFSLPRPRGLIDNDGPFIGTWPAAALIGYSIGARLGFRRTE
jgi:energy-coupling factor transporter transmembrane protein EcfT